MAEVEWFTGPLEELLVSPQGEVAAYLHRVGAVVESRAKLNLSDYDAVDTGRLRASITHVVERESETVLACYVGTNVSYALPVHNGRRPGARQPPTEPILEWARRVGIITNADSPSQQRSKAFLIARAIGRRGIKAKPYLVEALPAARGVT
jgi:hypothetical protein